MLFIELMFCTVLIFTILFFIFSITNSYSTPKSVLTEEFNSTFYKDPKHCSALFKDIDDEGLYKRMSKKLKTVKNDGRTFMGFHDKSKPYNDNMEYCYINTVDHTKSKKNVPCSKETDLYNFSMIRDVEEGTVQEPDDIYPKEVCIMEIEKDYIANDDIYELGSFIDRHDNSHLLETTDQYKEQLSNFVTKTYNLRNQNRKLEGNVKKANEDINMCQNEKVSLLIEKILLKSQILALKNNVVILGTDFDKYSDNTESFPKFVLNIDSGLKELSIPTNTSIRYIFVPKYTKLRLQKVNGSHIDYSQDSKGYPSTLELDTFNVNKVYLIDDTMLNS